jgi:hypothetical protein
MGDKERASKAGVEIKPAALIVCLLVAWLNGEFNIYEFTNDARIDSYKPDGFRAIGSGVAVAYGAYGAMRRLSGISVEEKFKIILGTTCQLASTCGGKMHIKRVTNNTVEDVT